MTKHIAGMILFTFIVGSSAIIAGLFYEIPEANSVAVTENYSVYKTKEKRSYCYLRRQRAENASVELTQAVFNSDVSRLTTRVNFEDESNSYGVVDLHFFVNDKYGTRFLKTERIYVSTGTDEYTKILDWMGRLGSRENLFVIPEVHKDGYENLSSPTFAQSKAIPIQLAD